MSISDRRKTEINNRWLKSVDLIGAVGTRRTIEIPLRTIDSFCYLNKNLLQYIRT